MCRLRIPEDRISMIDSEFDFRIAAFDPTELDGGGVHPPTGRINLDSVSLYREPLAGKQPPEVSSQWAKPRLRHSFDAGIAHEHEGAIVRIHLGAVREASNTALPIMEKARHLLRVIAQADARTRTAIMIHRLTMGHLSRDALKRRQALAERSLDQGVVRRLLAELGGVDERGRPTPDGESVEETNGALACRWWVARYRNRVAEEFALRLQQETACVLADVNRCRVVEPEDLVGLKGESVETQAQRAK
jgi:hypothetical protein